MGIEIERKFIVDSRKAPRSNERLQIKQGYLNSNPKRCVRIRIAGDRAYLTVKGPSTGTTRAEYEYSIPRKDAEEMLKLCETPPIEKTRHLVHYGGQIWEVDFFEGANEGLIIAEIELDHEDQSFDLPDWVDSEVSGDHRFANSSLSNTPFNTWKSST